MKPKVWIIGVAFLFVTVSNLFAIMEFAGSYFQQLNLQSFAKEGRIKISAGLSGDVNVSYTYPFFISINVTYQEMFMRIMGGVGYRLGFKSIPLKTDLGVLMGFSQVNTENFVGVIYTAYVSPRYYWGSEFSGVFLFLKGGYTEVWSYIRAYSFMYVGGGFGFYY